MPCHNSVVVNAPIADVWNTIRDFSNTKWAPNVVTSHENIGEKQGDQPGAKRVLNDAFHETLHSIDDINYTFSYTIDEGPAAVAKAVNYIGTVQLHPITESNTTLVVWITKWDHSEGGVAEFCNPIYQALLSDLKGQFEG